MSHFPENLSILRRKAGYTQEGLAEALGVSRQAVSKWESGQTLPEAATLLTLAELLDCTLDQLMREALAETALSLPEEDPARQQQAVYDAFAAHTDRFALMIGLGVALVLTGVALASIMAALWGEDSTLSAVPFFLCLAFSVFLLVAGGMAREDFQRQYPVVPPLWDGEAESRFRRLFRLVMAALIAGILVELALLMAGYVLLGESDTAMYLTGGLFFLCLGFTVGGIVYLSLLSQKFNTEEYNRETQGKGDKVSGVIMLTATIAFLLLGFVWNAWHPGWVVFPVGGLLCAIVDTLRKKNV